MSKHSLITPSVSSFPLLERANPSDHPFIWELYQEVMIDLERQKIFQWNAHYPTSTYIQTAIQARECWLAKQDHLPLACGHGSLTAFVNS